MTKVFTVKGPITSTSISMNDDEMLIYETVKIKDYLADDKVLNGHLKISSRKFGLLSYEEVQCLFTLISLFVEGVYTTFEDKLYRELKAELEIRG